VGRAARRSALRKNRCLLSAEVELTTDHTDPAVAGGMGSLFTSGVGARPSSSEAEQ